jgi:preprotein translocase subunit YajC
MDRSTDVENQQLVVLIVAFVLLGALTVWPQIQARRRRQKQMAEISVGDEVLTIGGIMGKLTYLNAEENRARIEIAPGVEMQILPAAISRRVTLP